MALNTLTPPIPPSREGARFTKQSRDLIANFGDGYEQRGIDGLNNLAYSVPLVFAYMTPAQAQTLATFLEGQTRALPFYYTLPWEESARKWRIGGAANAPLYTWDKSRGITDRIEVTLQEVFDTAS